MQDAVNALVVITGINWLFALAAAFVAFVAEAAKPPHMPGEEPPPTWIRTITIAAVLITAGLLLLSAVGASAEAQQSPFLPIALSLAVMGLASLLGALLGKFGAIGRGLHAAAPVIAVLACVLTIAITWQSVSAFVKQLLAR